MATATREVIDLLLEGTIDADLAEELLGAIAGNGVDPMLAGSLRQGTLVDE